MRDEARFDHILDPTGLSRRRPVEESLAARRPPTLANVRVGLLNNTKQNAAPLLAELGRLLGREHGAVVSIQRTKQTIAAQVDDALLKEIAAVSDVLQRVRGGRRHRLRARGRPGGGHLQRCVRGDRTRDGGGPG
jgi:hypothetical protein